MTGFLFIFDQSFNRHYQALLCVLYVNSVCYVLHMYTYVNGTLLLIAKQ